MMDCVVVLDEVFTISRLRMKGGNVLSVEFDQRVFISDQTCIEGGSGPLVQFLSGPPAKIHCVLDREDMSPGLCPASALDLRSRRWTFLKGGCMSFIFKRNNGYHYVVHSDGSRQVWLSLGTKDEAEAKKRFEELKPSLDRRKPRMLKELADSILKYSELNHRQGTTD